MCWSVQWAAMLSVCAVFTERGSMHACGLFHPGCLLEIDQMFIFTGDELGCAKPYANVSHVCYGQIERIVPTMTTSFALARHL